MTPVILASRSQARAALLESAGVQFKVYPSAVDEDQVKRQGLREGLSPAQIALKLSDMKALAIAAEYPGAIIGADQTLEMDGILFDKAKSLEEARERLRFFRDRTHLLHAAVTVASGSTILWRSLQTAKLTMRSFSEEFLDDYLSRAHHGLLSAVGCYKFEEEGIQLFEKIEGDYFTILGLPLIQLLDFLRRNGNIAT